ncbi:manganese peroxidase [Panaeolus papilionaceus]|nr:manganese peroxidase [Panaeolus papilionaceus]
MAFSRLTSLIVLALGASVVHAGITKSVTCPTGHVTANKACCVLFPIVENLLQAQLFDGGECGEEAHSALRLSFHDAIGFSKHGGKGGGADGSVLVFNVTENAFHANSGIEEITDEQFPVWQASGLTAGDFVHLAAAVGTANCPGAPRLQFMFGRPPPLAPAADLTVPEPTDTVDSIIARFADAGFSIEEGIALLSSHTVAAADEIDTTIPGTPFDSTPFTFDTQFFLETLLVGNQFPGTGPHAGEVASPLAGEMRLQSDSRLARDPRTACFWQAMINNQERMVTQFKTVMAKLQVLGQDVSKMVDCSDVIPIPPVLKNPTIKFPGTFSQKDVQVSCPELRFPKIATVEGPAPTVAPVPGS